MVRRMFCLNIIIQALHSNLCDAFFALTHHPVSLRSFYNNVAKIQAVKSP